MATNLRKFNTLAEYEAEVQAQTLVCPNVSYILAPKQVKYLEVNPPIGVGICAYESGRRTFYSATQWQALAVKPTVVGVFVKSPDTGFVIHPTASQSNKITDTTTYQVPGCTSAGSQALALQDFRGAENTAAYLAALENGNITNAPAITWVSQQTFADGSTPFLWAAGQLELARVNATEVNACLALISGGVAVNFATNIWSSTQNVASHEWLWFSTYWGIYTKYSSYLCRACASL